MLGHEYALSEATVSSIDSVPSEQTTVELEARRVDTVIETFDTDRRNAMRILSGPLLGALHDIRLGRDEKLTEADGARLASTLAELNAAVENLLRYHAVSEPSSATEKSGEAAA